MNRATLSLLSLLALLSASAAIADRAKIEVSQPAPDPNAKNTYFTLEKFNEAWGHEGYRAHVLYEELAPELGSGNQGRLRFTFVADRSASLLKLRAMLTKTHRYQVQMPVAAGDVWKLTGETTAFAFTDDNLVYWAFDMLHAGFACDARIEGFVPLRPFAKIAPLAKTTATLVREGEQLYDGGNLSGALFVWTLAIEREPKSAVAYWKRAAVKNRLFAWKMAVADYDKALELDPDQFDALINRGSIRDEHEDPDGAIADYTRVLSSAKAPKDQKLLAAFNRGNTNYRKHKQAAACADWKTAADLGDTDAVARLKTHCK